MQKETLKYLTDGEAVELAIRTVVKERARVLALSKAESDDFQKRAALILGYKAPLTPEEEALNFLLTKHKAGKASCEKAWKLYHFLRL